ncbi:MAG: ABC transporter permease [Eubacteriales bacterium]
MKQRRKPSLYIGSGLTIFFITVVIIGRFVTPYDPQAMDVSLKFAGISWAHPLGCDQFGRDILSRLMVGGGNTLMIAASTTMIGAGIGIGIGGFSGYLGGLFDEVVMRLNDTLFSFPSILLALLLVGVMGPGTKQIIIALGISFIPSFMRMARSEFRKQKNMDYVRNAKLLGASTFRIVLFHMLPNSKSVLITSVIIGFNNAILAEAGLSFIGLGISPPNPSIGGMLSEAQGYLFSMPSYAFLIGGVFILFLVGVSLVAENLGREVSC